MARLEYALRAAFEAGESPAIAASELAFASIALQPHVHLLALRTDVPYLPTLVTFFEQRRRRFGR